MKEEEAKTKWCPMVRNYDTAFDMGSSTNRYEGKIESEHKCIASDCMMWVWDKPIQGHPKDTEKYGHCGLIK